MRNQRDIINATCNGLCYLIILLFIISCSGYKAYFSLTNVQLTVPISSKFIKYLNTTPLAKFEANFVNSEGNISNIIYQLKNTENILQINGLTGEIFMGEQFKSLALPSKFIISATNTDQRGISSDLALMTLQINPSLKNDFCQQYEKHCFWDAITYTTVEDTTHSKYIPRFIGEFGPKYYKQICPHLKLEYLLKNGTDFFYINDSSIYTNQKLDHDLLNPGSNIFINVQCLVEIVTISRHLTFNKVFHISILDRNDNGPNLQDNKIVNIFLEDPHFSKDDQIGEKIIFVDNDSLALNAHMTYQINNDTFEILQPSCNAYEADHLGLKNSVISCQLHFAREGILRKSPYCIELEAYDRYIESNHSKSAISIICIETDLNKIHESDRPTALALHSSKPNGDRGRRGRKNSRRLITSGDEIMFSQSTAQNLLKQIPIIYPRDVYVSRFSTNFSRVAQPERMIELLNRTFVRFKIDDDPTQAFNITPIGGIIFVENVTALKLAPETIYYLSISWYTANVNVIIHLENKRPLNTTCEELNDSYTTLYCSELGTKKDCNNLCGIGTDGTSCKWRNNNFTGLTINYSTCSPNLIYCPDNICDPLEDLTQKLYTFTCPQDCSSSTSIFGPHTTNDGHRGIFAASGICTCDIFGKCACLHDTFSKIKKSNKNKNQTKSLSQNYYVFTPSHSQYSTEVDDISQPSGCNSSCIVLAIGCPLTLIFIVIGVVFRRKLFRKDKKQIFKGDSNYDVNGLHNRTVELPLVPIDNFKFDDSIDSKWEFPREQLVLDIILGEGEFGKVVKAYATNIADIMGVTTVAVKTLKSGANSVEHLALISEFQLLQEVNHPNVIKLLGACTKGGPPLIIIEYAKYGSLRNYLRLSRKIECAGIEFCDGVEPITVKDILSFAWQICKGMAYLTEIKLVHRDLAARNVLLAEGKICKVSDFGLTRDVYEDDAYLKRSKDRVPVKWMAPESLADHVYTTKSDVWAFGILAWELITLGASPYPGVPPQNLYHLLRTGYRMERPENCSEQIYSIIRSCWTDDPSSRPSFKYLASEWEKLLGNNAKYLELEAIAVSNPVYCQDSKISDLTENHKIKEVNELESLDHLWKSPQNINYNENHENDTHDIKLPPGYDMPRPLIEMKTLEQNLRYENDLRFPLNTKNSRTSQLLLDLKHYSIPVKRGKSYIDMTNKNFISNNLDNEDVEKNISKNLSFRFSSLLNLSEHDTQD